jgi:hypothetical protein
LPARLMAVGHLEKPPHFDGFVIHFVGDLRGGWDAGTGGVLGH